MTPSGRAASSRKRNRRIAPHSRPAPRRRFDARRGLARARLASRGQLNDALGHVQLALDTHADDPEMLAVAGSIYGRGRYTEAAAAYDGYASRLAAAENVAIGTARARAQFLRAFDGRPPSVVSGVGAEPRTVPLKLVNKKVVVQGRVNGMPVEFVLDTGAERTARPRRASVQAGVRVLGSTLAAGVGSASWRRIGLARVDTLDVGGMRVRNVPVSVRAPAPGGAPGWQSQDPLPLALGLSVVVDYREHRVLLGP